jgi:predicted O-methyltransferase YrrM
VAREYKTNDASEYEMDYHAPHEQLEPPAQEIAVVDDCLQFLAGEGIIPHADYPHDSMLAHRNAVRDTFEIPWTAITPRMERLLYALNAIRQPEVMIAAGIFCGFTFICNAGAAIGPGACYEAEELTGLEINEERAKQAEENVRRLDGSDAVHILAQDAVQYAADFDGSIDLLYLDANGAGGRGKRIYLDILQAGYDRLSPGGLVLAHNSFNSAEQLQEYSRFVRDDSRMAGSVNVILDGEGLEVSMR